MKDRLKALRKALGLKQREVAERLGCQTGLIGRWEAGLQPIPATRIYQLCKEYNVRREWLEHGEGEMFAPRVEVDEEREREIQHAFCLKVFNSLPPEIQKVVLDALREFSSKTPKEHAPQTPKKEPADLPPETYSTVAQTGKDDLNA